MMISRTLLATAIALSIGLLPVASHAATITLTAGVDDGFAAPADAASPSAALGVAIAAFAEGPNSQSFDLTRGVNGGSADRQVADTFLTLPAAITAGTLTVRVRASTDAFAFTDGIALSFVHAGATDYRAEVAAVYSRGFGGSSVLFTALDPGLLQSTLWQAGIEQEFTLNLAALPRMGGRTLNLLPLLNSNGFLDVNVTDDAAADFMRLNLTSVPLPGTLFPLLGGLALLGSRRGRRSRRLSAGHGAPAARSSGAALMRGATL